MPKSKFIYDVDDHLIIVPAEGFPPPREPRSLRDERHVAYRQMLLSQSHMKPLTAFVHALRQEDRGYVPDFDPLDGGVNAKLLFLMEKPGPMTDPYRPGRRGSGFISRDNDDQSAAATFTFMRDAGLPRQDVIIWNSIPWWNGQLKMAPTEKKEGLQRLVPLLDLLPRLRGVVLVGQKAALATNLLAMRDVKVWHSAHPSPRVRARYPEQHGNIPKIWAAAAAGAR